MAASPEFSSTGKRYSTVAAAVWFAATALGRVIVMRCAPPRGARFHFEYLVTKDGAPIAEGTTGHACVDAATLRPTRVPQWLIDEIVKAEPAASASSS